MPAFSSFVKLALAIVSTCALEAYALNDWSVPCFDGQCSYDLPSGGSGSLQIWGSSNSISDITAAAGWTILTCDSSLASQDIRLVCNNDDPGCQNLFDGAPEGKIIRLPETCSSVAFAIVTSVYVSDDQSLPSNFNIGSSQPQVKGLSFGTSWPSSAPSGNVNFAIQASSIPGQNNTLNATAPSEQRRQHARSWVPPVAVAQRRNFLSDALSLFSSPTFEEDIVNVVIPVEVQETSNILQINAECGSNQFFSSPFEAIVDVNVDAAMSANIEVAVVATGTIIPPQFTDFAVFTDMDATIKSTMRIQSNALGSLQSETIDVFQTSLSGLNFPGILNIEPTFQLQAAANADLDFDLDASVDLAFEIKDAQLVFPPSRGSSGGTFTRTASNVNVSASAVIDSAVKFVGQLTPSINIGVNAFGTSTTIFLNLDSQAEVDVQTSESQGRRNDNEVNIQSCSNVISALSVNAGVQDGDNFYNLFDKSTSVALFEQDFTLVQQECVDVIAEDISNSSNSNSNDSGRSSDSGKNSASSTSTSSSSKSTSTSTSSSVSSTSTSTSSSASSTSTSTSSSVSSTSTSTSSSSNASSTSSSTLSSSQTSTSESPSNTSGASHGDAQGRSIQCPSSPPAASLISKTVPASN